MQRLSYEMAGRVDWDLAVIDNLRCLEWVLFWSRSPICAEIVEWMTIQLDTTGRRKTWEKQRASDGEIKPETEQESENAKVCFLNYFCSFLISIELPQSLTPKPCFISETGSLCQSPFGQLPQISKPRFNRREQYPCFQPATQRTAWCHTDQESGRVESCCAISSACSCFVSFPSNILFFPPLASSLNFTVCLRTCRLVKCAKKKPKTKTKHGTKGADTHWLIQPNY